MDSFIGTILMFAGNFAPMNWAFCDGAILAIAQYQALFSILGTVYGGNGTTTFGLPDLRGRVPVHVGAAQPGQGLSVYTLGEMTGVERVTLTSTQLPQHNHTLSAHQHPFAQPASSVAGRATNPNNAVPALTTSAAYAASSDGSKLAGASTGDGGAGTTGIAGGSNPVGIIQPVLGINYIICMNGIYPSRG